MKLVNVYFAVIFFTLNLFTRGQVSLIPQVNIGIPIDSRVMTKNNYKKVTKYEYGIGFDKPKNEPDKVMTFYFNGKGYIANFTCANDTFITFTVNYDSNNNINSVHYNESTDVTCLDYIMNMTGQELSQKHEYEYYKNQKIKRVNRFSSAGILMSKLDFKYSGNDITEAIQVSGKETKITFFNSTGLVKEIRYCDSNDICISEYYKYEYENDLITSKTKVIESGILSLSDEWTEVYKYDTGKRLLDITLFDFNYDQQYRIAYTYGADNIILRVDNFGPLDNPVSVIKYVYE